MYDEPAQREMSEIYTYVTSLRISLHIMHMFLIEAKKQMATKSDQKKTTRASPSTTVHDAGRVPDRNGSGAGK